MSKNIAMLTHIHPEKVIPSRVVVMGAKGFIGSAILRRFISTEIPALGLGRPEWDLTSADAGIRLGSALRKDDTFVFASAVAPCKNIEMMQKNLVMADAVCTALQRTPVAHVVYISSDAVYKDSKKALTEESCAEPSSLHGAMHLTREIALRQAFPGPLTLVRPTLVYGYDDPHNGYGPNRFRRLATAGREIVLFGEGEERRDHVYVEDVAELVRLIVLHQSTGVANAVSGDVVSFRELAEFVAADFSPSVKVRAIPRSGPMPHDGYRPFDNRAVLQAFPGFRCKSWRDGLSQIHARQRADGNT